MGKKPSVTDVVEAAFYVSFKNPLRSIALRQKLETLFDSVCGGAALSEAIRVGVGAGFRDWLQTLRDNLRVERTA